MTDVSNHKYDTENIVWSWDGYDSASAVLCCINDNSHSRTIIANISNEMTQKPSCLTDGMRLYTASISIDNVIYTSTKAYELSPIGHTEITDAAISATCNKSGLTQGSHCSVCNEVLVAQVEIPMIPHVESTIEAVKATCTSEGANEGKKCSVCDKILVEPQPVAKLSHIEQIIEGKAPTCSTDGCTQGKICSACHEVLIPQEIISKTGCSYESVVTAPTCKSQGYTTFTCAACGDTYTNGYVNAREHSYGEWEEYKDFVMFSAR